MSKLFTVSTIVYLTVAATAGISALVSTLWAYNLDNRMVSDTVTAAIINTAAAMAAMGFFGGFDMVLSIWQFFRNQEAERARNQEREEERKWREDERRLRAEEHQLRLKERETARTEREEMMEMLRAAHRRNEELHARVMEFSELAIQRANGGEPGGNTENDRGE